MLSIFRLILMMVGIGFATAAVSRGLEGLGGWLIQRHYAKKLERESK